MGDNDQVASAAPSNEAATSDDETVPSASGNNRLLARGGDSPSQTNINAAAFKITITASQSSYTVVVDDKGQEVAANPILAFQIAGGPPNALFDIQLSVDDASNLTGGPGIGTAWDPKLPLHDRFANLIYSSWKNGDSALRLDGAGSANYKMPLQWWLDMARGCWKDPAKFKDTSKTLFCRVISVDDDQKTVTARSSADGASSPAKIILQNNCVSFNVIDNGYNGSAKPIVMELVVRVPNTTGMYTFVQWVEGYTKLWQGPGQVSYKKVINYGIEHDADHEVPTIDSVTMEPRFITYQHKVSPDGTTLNDGDNPQADFSADSQDKDGKHYTHCYSHKDFTTCVYLNCDVPSSVKIIKQFQKTGGNNPDYGVVTGDLSSANDDPLIVESRHWNVRVLQVAPGDGTLTVLYPETFDGP